MADHSPRFHAKPLNLAGECGPAGWPASVWTSLEDGRKGKERKNCNLTFDFVYAQSNLLIPKLDQTYSTNP